MTGPALPPPETPRPGQPINRYGQRGALTDALQDRIVQVVAAGNYLKTAAQFCGIGANTLSVWLSRGRNAEALAAAGQPVPDPERRYLEFLQAVTQAETQAEVAAVTHWRRSFGTDWRAARDFLGRKRPELWAAKTTISISSEEAEARIEAATLAALTDLGVDVEGVDLSGALDDPPDPDEEPDDPEGPDDDYADA